MKSILERKKELDLLVHKLLISYKNVRLEYNLLDRNVDISSEQFKQQKQVQSIENSIENIYVKMLEDSGIDVKTQNILKNNENSQIKNIHQNHEKNENLKVQLKNKSHVQNGALERKRIIEFRLLREKICLCIYIFLICVFLYVSFKDIRHIDKILFTNTTMNTNLQETPSRMK